MISFEKYSSLYCQNLKKNKVIFRVIARLNMFSCKIAFMANQTNMNCHLRKNNVGLIKHKFMRYPDRLLGYYKGSVLQIQCLVNL